MSLHSHTEFQFQSSEDEDEDIPILYRLHSNRKIQLFLESAYIGIESALIQINQA